MQMALDLAERWRRARRSALRAVVAEDVADDVTDDDLAVRALERAADDALRAVFDVSRRLGLSFRAYYRVELPLADLVRLLPAIGAPCTSRDWSPISGDAAQRAERAPCGVWSQHPRACALWREAIDGLVAGLSGEVRFARHASRGAGDGRCVDVLHVHPRSPSRYGPIPEAMRDGLDAIARTARALDGALDVELLGMSEGVLYYRAQRAGGVGAGEVSTSIEPAVRRRFPDLVIREVSPRPVLTPDAV